MFPSSWGGLNRKQLRSTVLKGHKATKIGNCCVPLLEKQFVGNTQLRDSKSDPRHSEK